MKQVQITMHEANIYSVMLMMFFAVQICSVSEIVHRGVAVRHAASPESQPRYQTER